MEIIIDIIAHIIVGILSLLVILAAGLLYCVEFLVEHPTLVGIIAAFIFGVGVGVGVGGSGASTGNNSSSDDNGSSSDDSGSSSDDGPTITESYNIWSGTWTKHDSETGETWKGTGGSLTGINYKKVED